MYHKISQVNQDPQAELHRLIERHADLVKKIAAHLLARLPANVSKEDLVQSGMIGLIEASKRYDASKGASFETFASIRIKGAMLDEIRRGDWVPRSVHRNTRKISEAIRKVENRHHSEATDAQIADELGVSIEQYYEMLQDTQGSKLFNFSELNTFSDGDESPPAMPETPDTDNLGPSEQIENKLFKVALTKCIGDLPEREQLVLSLYYKEELNLKQIGEILGVTESRVSQIHSQAAIRLRHYLESWQTGEVNE